MMIFVGIDIGTSGIRASCINNKNRVLLQHAIDFLPTKKTQQNPLVWLQIFDKLLQQTSIKLRKLNQNNQITAIAIDGTSSTIMACRKNGEAISPALMYNHQQCTLQAQAIAQFSPSNSAVHGASSSFAKALYLLEHYPKTEIFCHQSDWLTSALTGIYGISDENNCLKLGFDSSQQCWPHWLHTPVTINNKTIQLKKQFLPKVLSPGTVIAKVKPDLIKKYQLAKNCVVVSGTTDSNAAVLASGAQQLGDAVSSLGSTLVLKVFADRPIFNAKLGIYSHRLNNKWLVGGASNTGGNVLLQHFNFAQIKQMSNQLDVKQSTGLNFYPLAKQGERFPINDPFKKSMISPKPKSPIIFFQALLEGIANIEAQGYAKLQQMGAPLLKNVYSCGGGSENIAWTKIRQQTLAVGNPKIKLKPANNIQACYGSALLAKQGFNNRNEQ